MSMSFDPRLVRDGYPLTRPRTGTQPIIVRLDDGPKFDRALVDTISYLLGDVADELEASVKSPQFDGALVDIHSLFELLCKRRGTSIEELARKDLGLKLTTGFGDFEGRLAIVGYEVQQETPAPEGEVSKIGGGWLKHHSLEDCSNTVPCCIHDPSDHPMKDFPLVWRDDQSAMERRCPHDIGHPDPDDLMYKLLIEGNPDIDGVHGCCQGTDGRRCCEDSYGTFNELIANIGGAEAAEELGFGYHEAGGM